MTIPCLSKVVSLLKMMMAFYLITMISNAIQMEICVTLSMIQSQRYLKKRRHQNFRCHGQWWRTRVRVRVTLSIKAVWGYTAARSMDANTSGGQHILSVTLAKRGGKEGHLTNLSDQINVPYTINLWSIYLARQLAFSYKIIIPQQQLLTRAIILHRLYPNFNR